MVTGYCQLSTACRPLVRGGGGGSLQSISRRVASSYPLLPPQQDTDRFSYYGAKIFLILLQSFYYRSKYEDHLVTIVV